MAQPLDEQFTIDTYPKSHGSIHGWRLAEFLHLPVEQQHKVYKKLEQFCLDLVQKSSPRSEHKNYPLLGAGWEWSVFAKDESSVIKVPAGIFPEVNEPEYLTNVQTAYEVLSKYYPPDMLAPTKFYRHGDLNVMEQARLRGQDWTKVEIDHLNDWLRHKLITFFTATATLIHHEQWLPDFWLDEDPNGLILRNVMVDPDTDQFAIIDFTSYLDPARMYPALGQSHTHKHLTIVQQNLDALTKSLDTSSKTD